MSKHYDTLETRSPAEREKALDAGPAAAARQRQGKRAVLRCVAEGRRSRPSVTSRAALARLPVLRKSMLGEVQKKNRRWAG